MKKNIYLSIPRTHGTRLKSNIELTILGCNCKLTDLPDHSDALILVYSDYATNAFEEIKQFCLSAADRNIPIKALVLYDKKTTIDPLLDQLIDDNGLTKHQFSGATDLISAIQTFLETL